MKHRTTLLPVLLVATATSSVASAQQPPYGAPPQGTAPTQGASPYGPEMQAGGLAPPPPMGDAQKPPSATEQELERAKEEDAGRGMEWVWLNVEGGLQHVGLQTFNIDEENFTAGFIASSSTGSMVGGGLGLRLLFLTVGARARAGFFPDWQLFSLGGELGIHIPLGNVEPHFGLGGGYVGLGSVEGALGGAADAVSIRGAYGRAHGGLDLYLTPTFSIGALASWELLVLTRPGVSPETVERIKNASDVSDAQKAKADALLLEGTSYGSSFAITGVAGLHF